MKTRAIVNLLANKGSAQRRWPVWQQKLEAVLGPLDVVFTSSPGHGTALARAAVADGCLRLIAAGGDGTVNEVLNGLVADDRLLAPDAMLCPVPLGTANELCRALGFLAAPDGAVQAVASGHTRLIDVLRTDCRGLEGAPATRYGYLVASFGGAATISHRTSASRWLKKLGQVAYFLMTPVVTMTYQPRRVRVQADDEPATEQTIFTGMIANAENGGGGMKLAPGAVIDDGCLDFVAFGALSRAEILFKVMPGLYDGRHIRHPKVSLRRGRRFRFDCDVETLVDVDGETIGNLPLTVTVLERLLRVPVL
ncbi:diacylglycerol kinase family protein [Reyranella sp. CPCC 100927]|uniref:diacylglycerol/lipid kinase family protein n=1 Tax=Reyranella sp. CPCC 100927 TaxID=2599616 RepID=UPI0015B7570D|nr:diacylglycerol kinase family protein [Reyranella sp. CPCC 100927]